MSEVQQLYRLQQIDTEIQEIRHRLGDVLKALKDDAHLLAIREQANMAKAELTTWQTRHKDLSLEDDALRSKAKRSEDRLYSGLVKNPKELTDLQNEIASLGKRRANLEDEILEAMIMVEEYEAEHDTVHEKLERTETEWQRSQAELTEDRNSLALRLQALTKQRSAQLPLVSDSAFALYEAISKRHGGQAVVLLKGNMCQGCQLNVSASRIKEVDEGRLVQCDICDRILTRTW